MNIRIIRKAITLLIVDVIIIIGIFVLQFRTDSSVIEKIGDLQLVFSQTETPEKVFVLQNKFRLSYNGVIFYFDDQTPVTVKNAEQASVPIALESWQKNGELSYILNFSGGVKVTFELASANENSPLFIGCRFPPDAENIFIPYNYSSNLKIQKSENANIIFNDKKNFWKLEAKNLADGTFELDKQRAEGVYSVYEEIKTFSFEIAADSPFADAELFAKNIDNLKSNLIAAYKANANEENLSEQTVVSYVAAQAEKGNYAKALEDVPASFKRNAQGYLSAPYLNNLNEKYALLEKSVYDYETKISNNVNANNLDLYTIRNISNYMAIHSKPQNVGKLLENTAQKDLSAATLFEVAGILKVYVDLTDLNPEYAKILSPVLPLCIEKITSACSYDNNKIVISENVAFLSVVQAAEIGFSVLRYGILSKNDSLQKAGYAIVNSYLTENASLDLRTLANLYPIIAYDNKFYPHLQIIRSVSEGGVIWAWTCAENISYKKESENTANITVDFQESLTHYVIIKGIPSFSAIYIYDMLFRTDPRFETYNSSGYVYKAGSETLLLKSRHKTGAENIRLDFSQN